MLIYLLVAYLPKSHIKSIGICDLLIEVAIELDKLNRIKDRIIVGSDKNFLSDSIIGSDTIKNKEIYHHKNLRTHIRRISVGYQISDSEWAFGKNSLLCNVYLGTK